MKQDLSFFHHNIPGGIIPESAARFTERIKDIASHKSGAYVSPEHSLRLPIDPGVRLEVMHQVERSWNTQLRYVIVVGIGGSNLGTKAIYDALRGTPMLTDDHPILIFIETVSISTLAEVQRLLDQKIHYPEEILVNLISKSGETTESMANFELIYAMLEKRFFKSPQQGKHTSLHSRIVVTTNHASSLWLRADKEGIACLAIPKEVGGRFSVFSPVGLFPLALVGIDIGQLCDGATDFLHSCLHKDNYALRFAESVYRAEKNGQTILNFFFFTPELESLGKWTRQLYGESLGKERDRSGKRIHSGITPIVSIGSTDLHSMAQLYLGGPRDKLTLFVHIEEHSRVSVPKEGLFLDLVSVLKGKSPERIMKAIYDGTIAAYNGHKLPFGEVLLPALSPYALGMFLEWQMLAVMYLGEMWHINTFDQPNVEDYKKVTRQILESSR